MEIKKLGWRGGRPKLSYVDPPLKGLFEPATKVEDQGSSDFLRSLNILSI